MGKKEFVNLELDVLDWNKGQMTVPGRKVLGQPRLDSALIARLREQESDLKAYGGLLFEALLPQGDPMRDSYRRAMDDVRRMGKVIRFKLTLSLAAAEHLHGLRWECLYDPEERSALARDPETAFSRYAPIGKDDVVPTRKRPRLLLAVAAPTNCTDYQMSEIDRDAMQGQLDRALRPLAGQMDWELMTAPVTPSRLRARLFDGEFDALHLVAHSYVDSGRQAGILVMEKPSGQCDFVDEEDLSEVFLGDRRLRLVTLISCHGGIQSLDVPLSGLGRRLVDRGLPAVISMQDTVSFATAEEFPRHFYGTLARCGSVDAALNETRHQLFLTDRRSSRWSDPVLFMRLATGEIWRDAAAFSYDAYVSYAEADRAWVEEELVPRLKEADRRVCLEHDLAPGGGGIQERSRAVARSRKTLLVISQAYLESRWAPLEEAMALGLDPAARKRRLIPVLRDDCEAPLRIRPLVTVDLRRDGDARQWRRLLTAVDPTQPEEPGSLVQQFSLRLDEATSELAQPSWHAAGAASLVTAYLALAAVVALVYLLLWDIPALSNALALPLIAAHVFAGLGWREDRDLFRRLSRLLGRSWSVRGGLALLTAVTAFAWWSVGVPAAHELYCGPWGCKEEGKVYLTFDEFDAVGDAEAASWAAGIHQELALKLQAMPEVEVFGLELPAIDDEARRQLRVDYNVVGRFDASSSPPELAAYLWDRRNRPAPPEVRVRGAAGGDAAQRMELQNRLAAELLKRLGFDVEPATAVRLAKIPTDEPRAVELNEEAFRWLREERYSEAVAALKEALELDDGYSVAWSNLAEVMWRVGRYDEALEHRRNAVRNLPSYAPFHYNLGHLLAFLGRDEEALEPLARAAALDRAHVPTYNETANVLLRLGDAGGAVEALRKGLLLEPDSAPLSKNLGRAFLAAGEVDDAVGALERSLDRYPPADWLGRAQAHSLLVEALVRQGEEEAACRHLGDLQKLDPDGVAPWTPAARDAATGLVCADKNPKEDFHV